MKKKKGIGKEDKYIRLSKRLIDCKISKKRSDELTFHLMEIEYSFTGMMRIIDEMLNIKEKKKIIEGLDNIYTDLEYHVINNHLIPAKNVLDKILN